MASKKKPNRPRPPAASRPVPRASQNSAEKVPAQAGKGNGSAVKPARDKSGPTRAQRLAAAEAARRRKASRNKALITSAVVGILVLFVVSVIASRRSNDRTVSRLEASGSCSYDTKADADRGPGNNHVDGNVVYKTDPPAGGDHNPTAAAPGTYTLDKVPPDGQLVHALEHGYVILWYRPDATATAVDDLKALAGRYDRDVLLVPRPSLTRPEAATAWHRRLLCSQSDVGSLETFVTSYRNKGPEKVPH